MSAPDSSTDPTPPETAFSEAVEQTVDAAKQWCDELTKFVKGEVTKLSSGDYGLNDIATTPVHLARIFVKKSFDTMDTMMDNLSLLSYAPPGASSSHRIMHVQVRIPPSTTVKLVSSDLVGRSVRHRIPSSKIRIAPDQASAGDQGDDIVVEVKVDCSRAPKDLYEGRLNSADGAVSVPFIVAINELGEPLR